jgi:hypothetical protein
MEEEEETVAVTTDNYPPPPFAVECQPPKDVSDVESQIVGDIRITGPDSLLVSADNVHDNADHDSVLRQPTPPPVVSDCDDEASSDIGSVGSPTDGGHQAPSVAPSQPPVVSLALTSPANGAISADPHHQQQPPLGGSTVRPPRHVHIRDSIEIHEASDSSRQDKRWIKYCTVLYTKRSYENLRKNGAELRVPHCKRVPR